MDRDRVAALAPDQASLEAARKLVKPGNWPTHACDGAGFIWGECLGSGATPYRVVVSEIDGGYRCTCPSRKLPCKHCLALMWMRADGMVEFAHTPVPDWVKDWRSRRRNAARGATAPPDQQAPSSVQIPPVTEQESDLEARSESRAVARERNRQLREASILAGLDELDLWLSDQLEKGLAGFPAQAGNACRLMAQRLVDAKASGLATRVDTVPTSLFALPEAARPTAAVEELALLHLLAEAYRRQDMLPAALKADVRQMIGWTVTREALLTDHSAVRHAGSWRVVATLSEVQPDRLRRLETWLWREGAADGPRCAVLIDFVPASAGAVLFGYSIGDRFEAELVFYPAAVLLRAMVVGQLSGAQACAESIDLPDQGVSEAYAGYERALCEKPWLGAWPLSFRSARLRRHADTLFLCDAEREADFGALPLRATQANLAAPLLSLERLDGIGIWDGRFLTLCWAQTELGLWTNT